MIRYGVMIPCVLVLLAGCSHQNQVNAPRDGVAISGTAVMGVAGGSGGTRFVSGFKDVEFVLGVNLN